MLLRDLPNIISEIKDKYHQYDVEYFKVKQYNVFVEDCDVQDDKYCIDFGRRIIYIK